MESNMGISWPQIALDAVAERESRIPESLRLAPELLAKYHPGADVRSAAAECGLLSQEELDITRLDCVSILARIKSKDLTAVGVVSAFAKRAAIAHQLLGCLSDFFLEDALIRAKELDDHYTRTGQLVGPLHGLPISIKDHMDVQGRRSTFGFSGELAHPPAAKHGILAQILYDAGAVFYLKTNLPQAAMHLETHSFWGRALNPFNTELTSGGSSGGCSALIAFGGAPLSIGSDIGGSLRSPAAACGLWTLKPTTQRLPTCIASAGHEGCDSIFLTYGPICRSLRDIDLFFSVVLGSQPWFRSSDLVPLPWRMTSEPTTGPDSKPLRVGVMWHDGVVLPQPPIRRALAAVVKALEDDPAFEVVDYTPFKHFEAGEMAHALYFPDGGARVRAQVAVSGEPLLPLTEWVITKPTVKDHTMQELWELHIRRDALRASYLAHYNAQNVDVVLCPVGPGAAPAHETAKYWGYTNVWNFLDYPAAVFPTGLYADPALDAKDTTAREFMSDADAYNDSCYNPETFAGAPLCLQVVARRYSEEVLVKAMNEISKAAALL